MTVADPSLTSTPEPEYMQDLVIQPKRGWIAIDWSEMYRFRELLAFLVWRDVKVRYKQSVLGVAWAMIVPILNMLVFTVIFHVVLNIGKDMRAVPTITAAVVSTSTADGITRATISVGSDNLVKAGMKFNVVDPDRHEELGEITVDKVDQGSASGTLDGRRISEIKAGQQSGNGALIPYAIFVYAALLPWQLFSNALSGGGMSLINQQHLLTKIYFPRLFLPTAAVGALLMDMIISFGVLIGLIVIYHFVPDYRFTPGWSMFAVIPLVVLNLITGLGVAYFLSAVTVTYRDFRFLVPFMNQILMYASFVGYPAPESLPIKHPVLNWIATLNPMYGIIDSFRAAVLGTAFHPGYLLVSIVVSIVMFIYGMFYFRKTERRFADIA